MRNKIGFSCFFILLILMFLNPAISAQENPQENTGKKDTSYLKQYKDLPILNNFRFMPSDVVGDPFINTFIKISAGTGNALDLKAYVKNLQGVVIDTLSGDLTYLAAEMEFQYAINNWLAAFISYNSAGRLGSNAYTILSEGISFTSSVILGGKIKIWENKKSLLSGGLEYKNSDVGLYSLSDFLVKVIELDGDIDSAKGYLYKEVNLSNTFANLNYAYALTDWLGFLGVTGFGVTKNFEGVSRGNVRVGAAAAVDFLNVDKIHFPIGILISGRYNNFSEDGEDINDLIVAGLRIGYTGHKDFDIGLENTYSSLQYENKVDKIKFLTSSFKIRYYF